MSNEPSADGIAALVDVAALTRFVNDHVPGEAGPITVEKHVAGYSNELG